MAAPTNVAASKNTFTTQVQITWTASTGATAYDVYRNTTDNNGTASKLNSADIAATSYNDTTALAGTTYYFWIVARNAAGGSVFSIPDTGTRSTAIDEVEPNNTCTTAQNLGTFTGPTQVNGALSSSGDIDWYQFTLWAAGSSANNIAIAFTGASGKVQAAIYANPAKSGPVASSANATNSATVSLKGLAAGTYYIRVYGSAACAYTMTLTPPLPAIPAVPAALQASDNTHAGEIYLYWNASTGATAYDIYRDTTGLVTDAVKINSVNSSDVTIYTYVDSVASGTTYYYWVRARNSGGTSGFSNATHGSAAAIALPATPDGVFASDDTYTGEVCVNWNPAALADGYQVWRNTSNTTTGATELTTTDVPTTTYDDTTAVAGTTYYYFIVADNAEGSSSYRAGGMGVRAPAIQEVKPNNTSPLAQNLGTLTDATVVAGGLSSSSDVGWYEFTISSAGVSGDSVAISFTGASGQVQAAIYANPAKSGPVATSTNATNSATISLTGLAAGTYYLRVYGHAAYTYTALITPS